MRRIIRFFFVLLWCETLFAQNSAELTMRDFRQMGIPFYEGNEVVILPTGEEKFDDMFAAIEGARNYIHLDYFKFQEDGICNKLFDLLQEKAHEGVKVRVLFDAFCNKNSEKPLSRDFIKRMRASGLEIYPFDVVRFPWVNHLMHRNHHKIAIIDGKFLYSGGMNVADYYLYGKPVVGEWRDMHFKAKGSIIDGYEKTFAMMWETATGEKLETLEHKASGTEQGKILIAYADRVPRVSPSIIRDTYCAAIDNARSMVQIVNPYPYLLGSVKESIYNALDRGVRVQFIASTRGDHNAGTNLTGAEMKKLMDRGAEVYLYEGGFHHSKYMVVDSIFCTIGTANLDARSLYYDYEVNSFFFDEKVSKQLQTVFEKDKAQKCTLLTPEEWKVRFPLGRRIKTGIVSIIKRMM